jgi:hypothetical protein
LADFDTVHAQTKAFGKQFVQRRELLFFTGRAVDVLGRRDFMQVVKALLETGMAGLAQQRYFVDTLGLV